MMTAPHERNGSDPTYWLNRDDAETRRLMLQSSFVNPITRWVLREAGLREGMTVLDVGSGPGDVALTAARLVGPCGSVVGVDLNPEMESVARKRASRAGLTNVEFVSGDCRTTDLGNGYDAVVGRAVLLYVDDPSETVRSLLTRLKPGGIVAFQEFNVGAATVRCEPPAAIWSTVARWVGAAAQLARLRTETGYALHQIFVQAGLPAPRMQLDAQVGGGSDWNGYDYFAATIRSMLPLILQSGVASAEEVDIDSLADRLRAETVAVGGAVKLPDLVSAWTRMP